MLNMRGLLIFVLMLIVSAGGAFLQVQPERVHLGYRQGSAIRQPTDVASTPIQSVSAHSRGLSSQRCIPVYTSLLIYEYDLPFRPSQRRSSAQPLRFVSKNC